ncbi:polyprenyl synthetase family protein [Klenkia sp. PcliD-1-E]|uniref:polyprenyl synthetase family protein n=1 Tax=Klenkia sp. PcliD-1-E TaxID=2954492 RepID=UPI002097FE17|nr:polyprenyl synthetase family protein [Klenkia sp. PcliD-1-E]MCO7219798.1 polyprenyl synthetase family protein [Klenkia sp. PcliD-1-E]
MTAGTRSTHPISANSADQAVLPDVADLGRLREAVSKALDTFLAEKRGVLAGMDDELVPVVDEVAAVAEGGKRLRPAFAYWGWRAVATAHAEDEAAVLRAVAALEFVHGSALVHDDVMDAAATRRGRPATHVGFAGRHGDRGLTGDAALFGTGSAILVGDLALVWSDELLRRSGISADALGRARPVWDTMRTEVTAGQYLDLLRAAGGLPGPEGALKVARYKSAGYTVQRPLHLGAAIADAGPEVTEAYTGIALPLGEAFQLRDDVLGVFGDPAVTGKSADEDLREGKQTLLVALAEQATDDAGRALLHDVLGDPGSTTDQLDAVRDLMRSTGALQQVEDRISTQTTAAREAIADAPVTGEARTALDALAVAATTRTT